MSPIQSRRWGLVLGVTSRNTEQAVTLSLFRWQADTLVAVAQNPEQWYTKNIWSSRALNADHPSPTQGLLERWEQGEEGQEKRLSGACEYLQVTPGDTAKSAIGKGNKDQSYSVLNHFRCSLYCEPAPGHVRLTCICKSNNTYYLSDNYVCSNPPASRTLLTPQSIPPGHQGQLSRIIRQ